MTGIQRHLVVSSGVTCLVDATANGGVTVLPGASLVVSGGLIRGELTATGAGAVQLFGTEVRGDTEIQGTTGNLTIAGASLKGEVALVGADGGEFDVPLVGSTIKGGLACTGITPGVSDFGVPNEISGPKAGDCADL